MDELVDILVPPMFVPGGEVKTRREAYEQGDWIGTFNLWILTRDPEPSIVYQQRSPKSTWAPNALDVTAGGHLQAGEKLTDGLREVEEELGRRYNPTDLVHVGRKLFVGFNTNGTSHNNVVDVYFIEDNLPLVSYEQEVSEVYALCVCPISELLKVHRQEGYVFKASGMTAVGELIEVDVSKQTFPENWDDYHYKIAVLADRYFKGDTDLIY